MPLRLKVAGREYRSDHLTLEQLGELEDAAGKSVRELRPLSSARDAFVLAVALLSAGPGSPTDVARSIPAFGQWLELVDDDRPACFTDGIATLGGRTFDDYLTVFAFPPFSWPPDVIRRQRLRDLDLLIDSSKGRRRK